MKNVLKQATFLALAAAVFSGFANYFNKLAMPAGVDAVAFTVAKNSLVAFVLIALVVAHKKWPEIKNLSRAQFGKLVLISIIGGAIPFALFFTGLQQTSALNASLIHKTLFIWVLIFGFSYLKERLSLWQGLGVGAIFAANLFVGGFQGFKFNAGELMILAATLLWGVENIIAKKVLVGVSSMTLAAFRMGLGSAFLALFLLLSGRGAALSVVSSNSGWIFLTAACLLGYVVTWYSALKLAPATYVATLIVPATLITNLLSASFVTHSFNSNLVYSTGLYLLGVTVFIIFAKKPVTAPALQA
ncbi:MAG: DMT family transporter [bacterium]